MFRIADVTELLLSNALFTMLVTKIQFYYFDRSESDLLILCLLTFMFGTANIISLANISLEKRYLPSMKGKRHQKNKLHNTSKCTNMYVMYFTINLLLHVSAQFPSSRSYTNVVKKYSNKNVLQ